MKKRSRELRFSEHIPDHAGRAVDQDHHSLFALPSVGKDALNYGIIFPSTSPP